MNKALRSTTTSGVSDERDVCVAFLLAAALVALVALLVGCGSTSSAPATSSAVSTPQLRDVRPISTETTRTYLGAISGTHFVPLLALRSADQYTERMIPNPVEP